MVDRQFTLTRTGQPPVCFSGEMLAEVDGFCVGEKEPNRWHEFRVYRTAGNQYVLQILYRSRWDGESDHSTVFHSLEPRELIDRLSDYDVLEHIQGFPPTDAYRDRQRRLEDDLIRRYRVGISDLYQALPAQWFAEEIA